MTDATVARSGRTYEIWVGNRVTGRIEFRDRGGQRVFFHTEISDEFRGRGLSSRLIEGALVDTRAEGLRIVPLCPAVNRFLQSHCGFADITDRATPEVVRWLDATLAEPRPA